MSVLDIMRGIIFAFSSCLLGSAYLAFVFKVKPFLLEKDPRKLRPKPVIGISTLLSHHTDSLM